MSSVASQAEPLQNQHTIAGIYIHIPFCKQACHYCDFHFSTSLKKKGALVDALCRELELRKDEHPEPVQTLYFGGGTPSLLSQRELRQIFDTLDQYYAIEPTAEVTLEANPDDLTTETLAILADTPINRLSIGVQSFFEEDLTLMNRVHSAREALDCVRAARQHFQNLSIDLIYGTPGMGDARWQQNIEIALSLDVPHISAYALTVEPRTALEKHIRQRKTAAPDEQQTAAQFEQLVAALTASGFVHYELSNFGKPGFFSRNNTAYWQGKPYLGIGPAAHSYNGGERSWNVANNSLYIQSIADGIRPHEREALSPADRYNEYVMTGLRTMWGVSLHKVAADFGSDYETHLRQLAQKFIDTQLLSLRDNTLIVTPKGKFLTDGLASELFFVP